MFNRKGKSMEDVIFYSGIYQFELPYLPHHFVKEDNGIVKVYTCDVEIHVGNEQDLSNETLASIIISSKENGIGTTNFIEQIAAQIKNAFIDMVILSRYTEITDHIRWIERNYYPKENFQLVEFKWDKKNKTYKTPVWSILKDDDWIIKDNKLKPYN